VDAGECESPPKLRALSIGTIWSDIVSERHNVANATALIPLMLHDPGAASPVDDLESDAST